MLMSMQRTSIVMSLAIAWCGSGCGQPDDGSPQALTLSSETGGTDEQGPLYTSECGNTDYGCVLASWDRGEESVCAIDCDLLKPCPTTSESAYGYGAQVADPLCIVDALRTMDAPMQLVHGSAIKTSDFETYYDVTQWDLWIVGPDHAVLRTVSEYAETAGEGKSTRVVGGTLPPPEAFEPCAEKVGDEAWTCVLEAIEWCGEGVVAGPIGDQPWC
jgi:hypothetical protein